MARPVVFLACLLVASTLLIGAAAQYIGPTVSAMTGILKEFGHFDKLHFSAALVGSRVAIAQDDISQSPWAAVGSNLKVFGFEADPVECARLNEALAKNPRPWYERHLPYALWSNAGQQTLYLTHSPGCNSLLKPHKANCERFAGYGETTTVIGTMQVNTTTLDHVFYYELGGQTVDFLHLDVQGGDLAVMQGGQYTLNNSVLGIQVEVEFLQHYENQPLFAEVDQFLRAHGFSLFTMTELRRLRRWSSSIVHTHPILGKGQLSFSDGIYLRDVLQPGYDPKWLQPEVMLKLAFMADVVCQTDYTLELLEEITKRYGAAQPQYNMRPAIARVFELANAMDDPANMATLQRIDAALAAGRAALGRSEL